MGRGQVSGGVSIPRRHATPVAKDLRKPQNSVKDRERLGIKSDQ